MSDDAPFEIGLVLAGAISAGAYTAGVVDFLIEALDAYEAVRGTWPGPNHAVRLPVMTGASAGGMTAAISALQLFRPLAHADARVRTAPTPNRLYASWVDEIDLRPLLDLDDLDGQPVRSILCSTILETIVRKTLAVTPSQDPPRPWIGRDGTGSVAVMTTMSNLSGTPYEFGLAGARTSYQMLNHGDDMRFLVGPGAPAAVAADPRLAGFLGIDPVQAGPTADALRGRFGAAALASGAFPVGLAARPLTRPYADYRTTDRVVVDGPNGFVSIPPIAPLPTGDATFVAVDGGMIDNEPVELARRYLHGSAAPNPPNRNALETRYAVLLVDPFPNIARYAEPTTANALVDTVIPTLSTLLDQSRFKPQELALALDETVRSRFAILPERPTRRNDDLKIASGALGGFGGFLHHSFRRHDYLLGRRNAQAFLRFHFALHEDNPVFAAWRSKAGPGWTAWRVELPPNRAGETQDRYARVAPEVGSEASGYALPIIPLTDALKREIVVDPADWPRMPTAADLSDLEDRLGRRLTGVFEQLADDLKAYIPGFAAGRFALSHLLSHAAKQKGVEMIDEALKTVRRSFEPPR